MGALSRADCQLTQRVEKCMAFLAWSASPSHREKLLIYSLSTVTSPPLLWVLFFSNNPSALCANYRSFHLLNVLSLIQHAYSTTRSCFASFRLVFIKHRESQGAGNNNPSSIYKCSSTATDRSAIIDYITRELRSLSWNDTPSPAATTTHAARQPHDFHAGHPLLLRHHLLTFVR